MISPSIKVLFGIIAAWLCFAGVSYAQPQGSIYDPLTVVSVSGEVEKVELIPHGGRMGDGVHIMLSTNDGDISVHLGPSGYLSDVGLEISKGDKLNVTGSKVNVNNATFIIAAEVGENGNVYILRDPNGIPMWSGRYR